MNKNKGNNEKNQAAIENMIENDEVDLHDVSLDSYFYDFTDSSKKLNHKNDDKSQENCEDQLETDEIGTLDVSFISYSSDFEY